jgi:hypothetical protein
VPTATRARRDLIRSAARLQQDLRETCNARGLRVWGLATTQRPGKHDGLEGSYVADGRSDHCSAAFAAIWCLAPTCLVFAMSGHASPWTPACTIRGGRWRVWASGGIRASGQADRCAV